MDQGGLGGGVTHPVSVITEKTEVWVLVNAHGNQTGNICDLLRANRERLICPDFGVRSCKCGDALDRREEDLSDVGAALCY